MVNFFDADVGDIVEIRWNPLYNTQYLPINKPARILDIYYSDEYLDYLADIEYIEDRTVRHGISTLIIEPIKRY